MQARVLRFRTLNLIGCLVLLVFNALLGVWPMVGMNLVLAAINVWFIVKLLRQAHDEAAFEVLQVGTGDAYLAYVLRLHRSDMACFQPDLDGVRRGPDHAFVVSAATRPWAWSSSTSRATSRGSASTTSPRSYRDFTPGEFVWRRCDGAARPRLPPGADRAHHGRRVLRPRRLPTARPGVRPRPLRSGTTQAQAEAGRHPAVQQRGRGTGVDRPPAPAPSPAASAVSTGSPGVVVHREGRARR